MSWPRCGLLKQLNAVRLKQFNGGLFFIVWATNLENTFYSFSCKQYISLKINFVKLGHISMNLSMTEVSKGAQIGEKKRRVSSVRPSLGTFQLANKSSNSFATVGDDYIRSMANVRIGFPLSLTSIISCIILGFQGTEPSKTVLPFMHIFALSYSF